MESKKSEIKCGKCSNFIPYGRDEDGTRVGCCEEFATQVREDWRCDGAGYHSKQEVW